MSAKEEISSRPLAYVSSRSIEVPLFPRIVNYGLSSFERLASSVDALPNESREWSKVGLLAADLAYLQFLSQAARASFEDVQHALVDFVEDLTFFENISDSLSQIDAMPNVGDLRFHALSMYVLCKLSRPKYVVETGVAHGKSSAFILLALAQNEYGSLISIDQAPSDNAEDGSETTLHGKDAGWIVPDYLKSRWTMIAGDARTELPELCDRMLRSGDSIDLFLHDSLHTKIHTALELNAVSQAISNNAIVCVDNINMGSGAALSEFLHSTQLVMPAFRDFAAGRVSLAGQIEGI